jgi:multiple sugar transport system substrate-binding protein
MGLLPIIISLTSCGASYDEKTVTVKLSGWQSSPSEQELLKQVIQDFEAKHPQIKVKYETINEQYMDVIKTRLIGDAAPDVFYLDAFEAPLLIENNVLEPLDSYITPEFDVRDFEPILLNAFRSSDRIYGLPKDFSPLVLFYNKKYFREADLTKPPTTWNELTAYSQKLTVDRDRDGRIDRYGLGITPELARQYFMLKAFGGKLSDRQGCAAFATEESNKGLQLIIDRYRQDKSAAQPSEVGASSGTDMFAGGKVAMAIEGPWLIPFIQKDFPQLDFATAEVPTVNGKPGTMIYTVAYVMNKKAKNKAAAWQLISYLTGKQGMKSWTKGGVAFPSRRSVLADLNYDRSSQQAAFVKGVEYGTVWQTDENLPIVNANFNNQFISALLGEQSLQSAMKKAQVTANREISDTSGINCNSK